MSTPPPDAKPKALPTAPHRAGRGFTLIELMVAVAIVATLVSVALPSYREHVIRGHLVDAASGLALMRAQMERHYQDNRSYASVGSFVTPCASTDASRRTFNHFVVSCAETPTATAYTLTATGNGPAAGFAFTVDQANQRATTAAPTGWSTCTTQWLLRRGASC
jgi:type IV pilus assembly protein PilE